MSSLRLKEEARVCDMGEHGYGKKVFEAALGCFILIGIQHIMNLSPFLMIIAVDHPIGMCVAVLHLVSL